MAYKFRIYPDTKRQTKIDLQLTLSKEFYNLLLEKSIKAYKEGNKKISMPALNRFAKEIEEDKKYQKYILRQDADKIPRAEGIQKLFQKNKGK